MGNCPSEFVPHPSVAFSCAARCPTNKGFDVRVVNGTPSCAYTSNPQISTPLKVVPPLPNKLAGSYQQLKTTDPAKYQVYADEETRFNNAIAIELAKIDKDKKTTDAFQALQAAENARDEAPEAYTEARTRYYTLTKGDKWVDEERKRIAAAEANPAAAEIVGRYSDMKNRDKQQKRTVEVVNAVKDKLLSVQDELQTSVTAFSRQLENVRNQINLERHKKIEKVAESTGWIESILNFLLIIALVVAAVALFRVIYSKFASPPPTPFIGGKH